MRIICTFLIALFSANVNAATFAERVAIANEIESQKETSEYFFKDFFPSIGPSMGGIMKMCLARDNANLKQFTVVVNVALNGELIDIDFEPKSNNTGACFISELAMVQAPPPPLCDCGVLPVAITMSVKP